MPLPMTMRGSLIPGQTKKPRPEAREAFSPDSGVAVAICGRRDDGDLAEAHFKLRATPGAARFHPSYQLIATHLGAVLRGLGIRRLPNGEAFAYDLCNAGSRLIRFTA